MESIRDYLKNHYLLFDGGFGTYYSSKYHVSSDLVEEENLHHPEQVKSVHLEYLRAGSRVITTNTFHAYSDDPEKCKSILRKGFEIAAAAAEEFRRETEDKEPVYIFCDIGPADGDGPEEIRDQYFQAADTFLECGGENFIFETMSETDGIRETIERIRAKRPEAFIMVSYGIMPDGYSREGQYYRNLLRDSLESGLVDIAGLNCVSSAGHMKTLMERLHTGLLNRCSVMPNAGYPVVRGYRTFFDGNPDYFADMVSQIADMGVRVLGGCCGTDPSYIRAVSEKMQGKVPEPADYSRDFYQSGNLHWTAEEKKPEDVHVTNRLWQKLSAGKKIIAVELDSPKTADVTKFMEGAVRLQKAGADCLTIADCPIARPRMDSTLLACKVFQELNLDVIPHMTCRDRNINATKALLLGAQAEGIRNVLLITGDPIPSAERDEVKKVYQFNSRKLIQYVHSLNEELFYEEPMTLFGALNVNVPNFRVELNRAIQKVEEGADGFLTQPVMTEQAFENLKLARKELGEDIFLLGGIIPVISERNGRFMQEEINGISLPEEMIASYHGADRAGGEALGRKYTGQIARKILPYVDGIYLMTPFNRIGLMEQIIGDLRTVHLRPHHLLCTQTFEGKGYSEEFVRNMTYYVNRMRTEPDFSFTLTTGADDLCAHCPNLQEDGTCVTEEKVDRYDHGVMELLNLREGESYSYRELVQKLNQDAPDSHREEICADCEWMEICRNHRNTEDA